VPKGMDNSSLILNAAANAFAERGYSDTSMDVVAQAAGVSKATVYALFSSKDRLFAAVIEREGERQTATIGAAIDAPDGAPVAEVLKQFAFDAAALLLSVSNTAMSRAASSEAVRSPEAGRLFYANGPDRLIGRLAKFLAKAMKRGDLRMANSRVAAAQFLAVIVGDLQLRMAMGLPEPSTAERRKVATAGVEMFLRAYQSESVHSD
jgi:TetR/AcrR family transcriptional regulator, mexJK operon transcriptional repressor